jgi:hypothetical protein
MIVYCASKVNATFPVEAPPTHVELKVPVGQTARAARTHPSHLPLLTLIVAPASTALSLNSAVPEEPVVDEGDPPQNSIVPRQVKKSRRRRLLSQIEFVIWYYTPAIPPQIASSATF